MISPMYFAVSSACMTRSRLPEFSNLAIKGDFVGARRLATKARQRFTDQLSISCMDQAAADMSLLKGDYEQAEKLYARAVSGLEGSTFLSSVSCRATGIQALFQNRLDVAVHCFRRNTEEGVTVEYRLESYATLALVYREAGLDKDAHQTLAKLSYLAKQTGAQDWSWLSTVVAWDLAAYRAMYASVSMEDHIFRRMNDAADDKVDRLPMLDEPIESAEDRELAMLLDARKQHLMNIIHLASGEKVDWTDIKIFTQTPFTTRSRLCSKYAWLEIGLAAIAGEHHETAKKLIRDHPWLLSSFEEEKNYTVRIDQNEYFYFLAKIQTLCANLEDNNVYYQRYVEAAFKAIHQFTNKLQKIIYTGAMPESASSFDIDQSAALRTSSEPIPVRCQQAFAYIKENSFRPDVSVREVATIMGVSERWLQLQFKRHYGCSPKVVIRTANGAVPK